MTPEILARTASLKFRDAAGFSLSSSGGEGWGEEAVHKHRCNSFSEFVAPLRFCFFSDFFAAFPRLARGMRRLYPSVAKRLECAASRRFGFFDSLLTGSIRRNSAGMWRTPNTSRGSVAALPHCRFSLSSGAPGEGVGACPAKASSRRRMRASFLLKPPAPFSL